MIRVIFFENENSVINKQTVGIMSWLEPNVGWCIMIEMQYSSW